MANSLFIKADEVAELLGVSRAEAYRIIKRLNDQLSSRGFIVVDGRVNRKYRRLRRVQQGDKRNTLLLSACTQEVSRSHPRQ